MNGAAPDLALAEQDRPNNLLIALLIAAAGIALAGVALCVNELFEAAIRREISAKVLEPPSTALRALRAEEERRLSRYQWVSREEGIVRVPLDRAVELVLKEHRDAAGEGGR
jgi:hypothetical protein